MLSASKLPEAIEEFAIGKIGETWRNRQITAYSTVNTVEMLGDVSMVAQGFRCKQLWLPDSSPAQKAGTAYALYTGETRMLRHIPPEMFKHCRFEDQEGERLDVTDLGQEDTLAVTRQTTYDLYVPDHPDAVKGTVHITRDVTYGLNGTTVLMGTVVGEQTVFDDDELDDFVHPPSESGLEVVEHYLRGTPPPQPQQPDELELLINGPDAALCQAERCARQMFEIMDILR